MAINTALGNKLLDSMVDAGSISFGTPTLDLVFNEDGAYPEYTKVRLNVNGIEGTPIMENASGSSVKNQEIIYFPENKTGGTCTATGWKLTMGSYEIYGDFEKVEVDAETGEEVIVKTPVTIPKESVPLFRKEDFKLNIT